MLEMEIVEKALNLNWLMTKVLEEGKTNYFCIKKGYEEYTEIWELISQVPNQDTVANVKKLIKLNKQLLKPLEDLRKLGLEQLHAMEKFKNTYCFVDNDNYDTHMQVEEIEDFAYRYHMEEVNVNLARLNERLTIVLEEDKVRKTEAKRRKLTQAKEKLEQEILELNV